MNEKWCGRTKGVTRPSRYLPSSLISPVLTVYFDALRLSSYINTIYCLPGVHTRSTLESKRVLDGDSAHNTTSTSTGPCAKKRHHKTGNIASVFCVRDESAITSYSRANGGQWNKTTKLYLPFQKADSPRSCLMMTLEKFFFFFLEKCRKLMSLV